MVAMLLLRGAVGIGFKKEKISGNAASIQFSFKLTSDIFCQVLSLHILWLPSVIKRKSELMNPN